MLLGLTSLSVSKKSQCMYKLWDGTRGRLTSSPSSYWLQGEEKRLSQDSGCWADVPPVGCHRFSNLYLQKDLCDLYRNVIGPCQVNRVCSFKQGWSGVGVWVAVRDDDSGSYFSTVGLWFHSPGFKKNQGSLNQRAACVQGLCFMQGLQSLWFALPSVKSPVFTSIL